MSATSESFINLNGIFMSSSRVILSQFFDGIIYIIIAYCYCNVRVDASVIACVIPLFVFPELALFSSSSWHCTTDAIHGKKGMANMHK